MSDIEGVDGLRARLAAIGDTARLLEGLQIATIAAAKTNTEPFRKTGNLGRSIRPGARNTREAFVHAGANYAAHVEKGTGIYGPRKAPIRPRRANVLAWRTGDTRLTGRSRVSGGRETAGWAFAKSVKGRPATPFLVPGATTAVRERGAAIVVELWNEAD